ncbi:MAG: ABC transporter substrate-binding protein [Chloroflexi bacterium]|nr:ABC transporter substrate-binding protein [Chloroflexota bacterium]
MIRAFLLLMLAVAALSIACGDDDVDAPLDKVVFMAGFKPQANLPFVAAYVAQEQGYFAEQDLDVEIRHASSGEHLKLLVAGDVHVTTAAATSVLKRRSDPELPIVAIALFGQKGQQAYIALKDSGVTKLDDWEGRNFGYKISVPPDYLAMLETAGVDRGKINEVQVGFDPRVLTEGRVDVLAVFKSNEPNIIRKLGHEVVLWDPADFDVPNMGLTYITTDAYASESSDVLDRFLRATLKAAEYALENREDTLDIILKYAPKEDRAHQAFMLDTELADATSPVTDERGLGQMTDEQWKALYDHLLKFEALPQPFDYNSAFTTTFLERAYDGNKLRWP